MPELLDGERIDEVNDKLRLIQKPDGLTFGTDALLLAGYAELRGARGVELGSGSGIISMLMLTRGKLSTSLAIEVQKEYAELTRRNAELNSLSGLTALCTDVRDFKPDTAYDAVFTNPPYMRCDSGRANELTKKNLARHEVLGNICDFVSCAARSLKYGGAFYAVYRPDRLIDIISAMREYKIEPKRMTFVHADTDAESSMVLIEGRAGGRAGMKLTSPLLIYRDKSHKEYTDDMNYIMENGSFPKKYTRK